MKTDSEKKNKFRSIASVIVILVLVLCILFNLLFFVSRVPTESMTPTISADAAIIVKKVMNHYDYGDIVVFYSDEWEEYLVKRLIGKSGDTIIITEKDGIYRNGEKLDEPYLAEDYVYEAAEYQVPEGSYFFLGDNRDDSIDSREWNTPYITEEQIKGKVVYILNRKD